MEPSLKRRISIASYWSANRIALLDSIERYEDSYAVTQEFREWITCNNLENDHIKDSILKFPHSLIESIEKDELLEL